MSGLKSNMVSNSFNKYCQGNMCQVTKEPVWGGGCIFHPSKRCSIVGEEIKDVTDRAWWKFPKTRKSQTHVDDNREKLERVDMETRIVG